MSREIELKCHPISTSPFDFNRQYGDLLPVA